MACAYAKYTGRLGCCLATSGPGGFHLLNGLYDAKLDQAPVLALTGQTYSDLKGSNFQQEVDMARLFDDVAVYNQEVINPNPSDGASALKMCLAYRCLHRQFHFLMSALSQTNDAETFARSSSRVGFPSEIVRPLKI